LKSSEEIFHQQTDYKKIILKFLGYKYYFAFSAFIALCIAFIISKTSDKVFTNYASLMISEKQQNSFMNSDDIMGSGFGLFSGIQNVENEIALLQSYDIVNQAVDRLNVEVSYGLEKNLVPMDFFIYTKDEEIYQATPIQVIFDQTFPQPLYNNHRS
jgi:hypothetical protein